MPTLAQKYTDIVLVGQGATVKLIKEILSYQTKKTFKHYSSTKYRFVSSNTMVIDGQKVSGKKFLVVLPEKKSIRSYTIVGDKPLLGSADSDDISSPSKSICIIGSTKESVEKSILHASAGSRVTLLCEQDILLTDFDMAVQEVVEKLLKKHSVDVVKNVSILSLEARSDVVHIVGEVSGRPYRMTTDRLIITPDRTHIDDIGLTNISESLESSAHSKLYKVGSNVLILKDSADLSLSLLYNVADFLLGKKRRSSSLDFIHRTLFRSPELCYFSIGILEQDYFDTHLSYRKSIAKVSSDDAPLARWFIKVITSTHNNIIGIHAVLPFDYQNIDLLINLVEYGSDVSELRSSCIASDSLAEAYVELIGELS